MSKESVLNDIRGKIDRERKLIQGFQTLKKTTQNAEVIQRCNNQIRETQSNIDYLQVIRVMAVMLLVIDPHRRILGLIS